MNQLFEMIKIDDSKIIVISKTYNSLGNYILELENELSIIKFKGQIVFDLLLSNGLNNQNRFMNSTFDGHRIQEPKISKPKQKDESIITNFYKSNIDILERGILFKKDICKLKELLV